MLIALPAVLLLTTPGCRYLQAFVGIQPETPVQSASANGTATGVEEDFWQPPSGPAAQRPEAEVPPADVAARSEPAPVSESELVPAFKAERPERIYRPVPVFSDGIDLRDVAGSKARFRVLIDEQGRVVKAELLETTARDNVEAAREALLKSRYRPVRTPQGFTISVYIEETLEF